MLLPSRDVGHDDTRDLEAVGQLSRNAQIERRAPTPADDGEADGPIRPCSQLPPVAAAADARYTAGPDPSPWAEGA